MLHCAPWGRAGIPPAMETMASPVALTSADKQLSRAASLHAGTEGSPRRVTAQHVSLQLCGLTAGHRWSYVVAPGMGEAEMEYEAGLPGVQHKPMARTGSPAFGTAGHGGMDQSPITCVPIWEGDGGPVGRPAAPPA